MNQQQTAPRPEAKGATGSESEFQRLLNQPHRGVVEFVPYGSTDKIKLTVPIVQNLIAVRTKSGKTCSEADAIKFLAMCQAKKINPFEGDCFLIGYDGRDGASFALVTAHQTYLKRAELHPEFDGMKSGIIVRENGSLRDLEGDFFDDGQEVVGGWATVYFKNRKQPMHKRLRLARFRKPFGIWNDDPAGMICKCAESDSLRSSFPTMLGGLYLREEIEMPGQLAKPDFTPATGNKPLFGGKDNGASLAPDAPPAAAAEQSEPPTPTAEPFATKPPPFQLLRERCKASNISEGVLLDTLTELGSTDGSAGTLEELAMSQPEVVTMVLGQWADLSARIRAVAAERGVK